MKPGFVLSACIVAALLTGCASTGSGSSSNLGFRSSAQFVGMTQEQIWQMRGEPFAKYSYPEGSSWLYNIAQRDMQRDRVLFNEAGLVISAGPAWSLESFEKVQPGVWTASQLQQNFGPPVRQDRPRPGLIDSLSDAPVIATKEDAERAASHNWIYGFREYNRYYIVTITVNTQGVVSAIEIVADPNNSDM